MTHPTESRSHRARHLTRMTRRTRPSRIARLVAAAVASAMLASPALADEAPQSVLDGPTGQIAYSTPTFTFSSSEPGSTFECRIDVDAWQPCASPWSPTLEDGEHVLQVRAVDEAGNRDPSPAERRLAVDTSGLETTIDGGPTGLTNDATPTFSFGSTNAGATFQCRLVADRSPLPEWAGCSSPLTFPAISDGAATLEVRAALNGRHDNTPARRAFSIDASAPETELTEGPEEGKDSPTRTPRFGYRSSEAGSRFECRLDNKVKQDVDLVAWSACDQSGFVAPQLRGGQHTFEVRAIDLAGNADPTPTKRSFRVVACEQLARFALVELRGTCLQGAGTEEAPVWESSQPFSLNGLPIPVPAGATAVIKEPVGTTDGLLTVKGITLAPAGIQLYRGDLSLKLPAGVQGDEKEAISFSPAGKAFGMPISGKAALRLSWPKGTDQRRAVLALNVALPSVFKSGPSSGAGSLTGDVAVRMDPVNGVQLDGIKIQVGNAYIGGMGIKSLCLSYLRAGATFVAGCTAPTIGKGKPQPFITCSTDTGVDRWDGALAIVLPTASKTELGLWGGLSGGSLSHAGAYVDNLGNAVPLAPGVFLDRVAIGVCVQPPPFKIKGEVGIAFGPDFNGHKAAKLSGWMQYTDAFGGAPWEIRAGGSLELFEREMANASFAYLSSGMIDFAFHAGFDFKVAKLEGDVGGWVETVGSRRFNVEGRVTVCNDLLGCVQGDALVSSVGVAGCATLKGKLIDLTGGVGYKWGGKVTLMAGSCSLDQWRAQRAIAARLDASGRRMQAPPQTVRVVRGQHGVAIRVRGVGGVPKVAFVGPDGRRISTDVPAGQGYVADSHMLMDDPEGSAVSALIVDPAPGAWTVEPLPGSVPLAGVDTADPLPDAGVRARVSGSGRARTLTYSYVPAAGRTVSFAELGPKTARTIDTVTGAPCPDGADRAAGRVCGRVRFTPADGGAGRRQIRAEVRQDGEGRASSIVTTYVAPVDAMPARPALRITRKNGTVTVRWRRVAVANVINLVVATSDGRRVLFARDATRSGSIRLTGVRAAATVRITARGMRTDTREGRPTTRTLRPKRTTKTTTRRSAR